MLTVVLMIVVNWSLCNIFCAVISPHYFFIQVSFLVRYRSLIPLLTSLSLRTMLSSVGSPWGILKERSGPSLAKHDLEGIRLLKIEKSPTMQQIKQFIVALWVGLMDFQALVLIWMRRTRNIWAHVKLLYLHASSEALIFWEDQLANW